MVVVAAGNQGGRACDYTPAFSAHAVTVGAYDETNTPASWSNYGECVDVWAPGANIWSGGSDVQHVPRK